MKRFWRDESGATSIEYALIGVLIFMVIVTAVTAIGRNLRVPFTSVSQGIASR